MPRMSNFFAERMARGQSKGTIAKCKAQLAIFLKALAKQYIPAEKVGETTIKEVNELRGALAEALEVVEDLGSRFT